MSGESRVPGAKRAPDEQVPAVGALPVVAVPVAHDLGLIGIHPHHVPRVLPEADRLPQSQEVHRPEALGLARVVVDGRSGQPEGPFVGGRLLSARRRRRGLQFVGASCEGDRTRRRLVRAALRFAVVDRPHTELRREALQPIAQAQGGDAVVAVVLRDVVEDALRRLVVAVRPELAGLDELHDRLVALLHVAGAHVIAHVERLELLDRVRRRADPQRPADDRVEIDEHALSQQGVDLGLADPVARGHREQVRRLVGRVVVDVQPRMARTAFAHEGDEALEGELLLGERVRPQLAVLLGLIDPAEEVVEVPEARLLLRVERVALEVEEEVAGVGGGDRREGRRHHDLEHRCGRAAGRRPSLALELQAGLGAQRREGVGADVRGALARHGEFFDRVDSGGRETPALGGAHSRDEQQIAVPLDLDGARRAPTARDEGGIAPRDDRTGGAEFGVLGLDHGAQARASEHEDRQQVVDLVRADRSVAEQKLHPIGPRDADPIELVGICRELHQSRHLRAAGELGVLHDVAAVGVAEEEVGEADEVRRREGGLVDDIRPLTQRLLRAGDRGGQGLGIPRLRFGDLGHARAVAGAVLVELAALVHEAEGTGALQRGVLGLFDRLDAPESRVEQAHPRELALRGTLQVARAPDNPAVLRDPHDPLRPLHANAGHRQPVSAGRRVHGSSAAGRLNA